MLNYGEAIKIPDIGVFQLKKEPVAAGSSSHSVGSRIIFSPTYSSSSNEKLSLFLTIDVEEYNRVSRDYTDKIFSLGIGKPLIPVSNTAQGNVATEELYIQKSIQERINDLLARSQKLESFDLWDDYLSEKTVNEAPTFEPELNESITNGKMNRADEEIIDKVLENEAKDEIGNNETEEKVDDGLKDFEEIQKETEKDKLIFDESNLLVDIEQTDLQKEYNELIRQSEEKKPEPETKMNENTDSGISEETLTDNTEITDDAEIPDDNIEEGIDKIEEGIDKIEEKIMEKKTEVKPEPEVKPEFSNKAYSNVRQKNDNSFWYILGVFVLVTLAGIYYFVIDTGNTTKNQIAGDVASKPATEQTKSTIDKNKSAMEQTAKPAAEKQVVAEKKQNPVQTAKQTTATAEPPVQKNIVENGNNSAIGKEQEVEDLIFYNGKFYAVQISSWKNKNSARKAADKIRKRGYDTEVVSADLGSRGTWHRVRITNINSLDKARKIKKSFIR